MTDQFSDAEFMSAKEKSLVLRDWIKFFKRGLRFEDFTERLYKHLINHCSFIAHYNRAGFFSTYFDRPQDTSHFLNQFDRSKGCVCVEYGMTHWIRCQQYYDLNNAMVDAIAEMLPDLRERAKDKEVENAQLALQKAQERVQQLQERSHE